MTEKTVESFMTKSVISLKGEDPVFQAIKLMAENSISCVIVVDDSKNALGIVTERDMIKRVFYKKLDPEQRHVSEIMSSPVVTISKDMGIFDAMMIMQKNKFRRLVVVDHNNVVIGLITQTDMLRAIISMGIY